MRCVQRNILCIALWFRFSPSALPQPNFVCSRKPPNWILFGTNNPITFTRLTQSSSNAKKIQIFACFGCEANEKKVRCNNCYDYENVDDSESFVCGKSAVKKPSRNVIDSVNVFWCLQKINIFYRYQSKMYIMASSKEFEIQFWLIHKFTFCRFYQLTYNV